MGDSGPATKNAAAAELETVQFEKSLHCIKRMVETRALNYIYPGIDTGRNECIRRSFLGEQLPASIPFLTEEEVD